MELSEKHKTFLQFLFDFWKLHQTLNSLKKMMIIIANVLPKLQTVKNLVRPLTIKRCFKTRFHSQHVKACKVHAKSPRERFHHVFSSFSGKLIWKLSTLLLREILRTFLNTLTAEGKYPIEDWKNLALPIQIQLSGKINTFSQFLFHLWNLYQILNIFLMKMIVIADAFPKLQTVKVFVRPLSKNRRFRKRFAVNMWKCPKYLQNHHESAFIMCFHDFRRS